MRYYDYSVKQLEEKAAELLIEFDAERLHKVKPIDVYAVIEKCLNVPYDWKYLSPDQSILGATAFNAGCLWVWPENKYYDGLMPYQIYVEKDTILIEQTLTERDNRGRENFTVMHEVFHQVLHKKCFQDEGQSYMHSTYSRTIDGNIRCDSVALRAIERQANACAAAFLMPAELTKNEFLKHYARIKRRLGTWRDYLYTEDLIKEMSSDFSVSKQAMSYRLQNLGLLDNNGCIIL